MILIVNKQNICQLNTEGENNTIAMQLIEEAYETNS